MTLAQEGSVNHTISFLHYISSMTEIFNKFVTNRIHFIDLYVA